MIFAACLQRQDLYNLMRISWAEVQVDSFSFEWKACAKMKGLEVEMEQL